MEYNKKTKVLDYNYYIGNNDIIAKDVFINNYSVEPVTLFTECPSEIMEIQLEEHFNIPIPKV